MVIRNKAVLIVVVAVVALAGLYLVRGVYMKLNYTAYQGKQLSFEYPRGWTLRESKGSLEKYFQVHVFGKINKEIGFGPSITLTVYPIKETGGKFVSLEDMVQQHRNHAEKLEGYKLEHKKSVPLACGVTADNLSIDFSMRLPLYKITAKDVGLKEDSLFFEHGSDLFILSFKDLASDFQAHEQALARVVQTLRLSQ